ncbi:protein kinase [Hassallia byssoidea VB512170]|uniref:non-specific serine/threonine protein kinase n=1 Tax=Hassallia byssoidea VB512170 TaxID=1304833 RepID=A0A846HG50_9CYAN|nr:serine/threonine-protein kinase [Hassalia byssoidea]NEU75411.1 protein kinase [Hassalia byssoidea VB512170]
MLGTILRKRYKIIEYLGSGGFGETYKAEDLERFNCLCVVKRLKPQLHQPAFLEVARKLFAREGETLLRLGEKHEQIPQLLAYFEENQEFYLIQEYVEGETLAQILEQRKVLSESEVSNLLKDVLKILDYIHSKNVIHRDIKPANLIRRKKDNKIVLIDFGAVKKILADPKADPNTVIIGTPGYMPLEQSQGTPQFCSDIYALGIIGIQALTGLNPTNFTRNVETDEINQLVQTNVNLRLSGILTKMVRTQSSRRYQLASEVLEILERENYGSVPSTIYSTQPPYSSVTASYFKRFLVGLGIVSLVSTGISLSRSVNTPSVCLELKVPGGRFSYSGSTTWQPFRPDVEKSIQNTCPKFQLNFMPRPGISSASGYGIQLLLKGQADFAISSRNITDDEYEKAKIQGDTLHQIPVAIDGTAVAVNHSLPISGLTKKQLRDILTGKITNLNQLGIPEDLKLTVYAGKNASSFEFLKQNLLGGQPLRQDIQDISNALSITDGIQKVINDKNRGGIFISSAAHIVTQCQVKALRIGNSYNDLISPYQQSFIPPAKCTFKNKNKPNLAAFSSGKYPLTNRLFVIYKDNDPRSKQAGEAYANLLLTPLRQELIEKAGFVRIK